MRIFAIWLVTLPFSLFTLPFLRSSHGPLRLYRDGEGHCIGVVVEVLIVGDGADAVGVLALAVVVYAKQITVVFVAVEESCFI